MTFWLFPRIWIEKVPFGALLAPIRSPLIGSFVLLIAMPPLFLLKQIDISLRLPRTADLWCVFLSDIHLTFLLCDVFFDTNVKLDLRTTVLISG